MVKQTCLHQSQTFPQTQRQSLSLVLRVNNLSTQHHLNQGSFQVHQNLCQIGYLDLDFHHYFLQQKLLVAIVVQFVLGKHNFSNETRNNSVMFILWYTVYS